MTPTLPYPPPHARRTDPAESRAAAKSATPTTACAANIRAIINNTIYTDEAMVWILKHQFTGPTIRRTIKALIDAGELVRVGTGTTTAGKPCRQWRKV